MVPVVRSWWFGNVRVLELKHKAQEHNRNIRVISLASASDTFYWEMSEMIWQCRVPVLGLMRLPQHCAAQGPFAFQSFL